jgi:hypothetical protein
MTFNVPPFPHIAVSLLTDFQPKEPVFWRKLLAIALAVKAEFPMGRDHIQKHEKLSIFVCFETWF